MAGASQFRTDSDDTALDVATELRSDSKPLDEQSLRSVERQCAITPLTVMAFDVMCHRRTSTRCIPPCLLILARLHPRASSRRPPSFCFGAR
jgi:hypothetical protein